MRRKTIGFLLILSLLAGSAYATYRWTSPQDVPPPFERRQFIEIQIVTVPVRHVKGRQEYTQDELRQVGYTVYPEEQVRVISSRILWVSHTGRSQEFQGRSEGIQMAGRWTGSRVRPDNKPGLVLDDLRFHFPNTTWAINPSARLMSLSFTPGRTTLGREFATVSIIAPAGDGPRETFVRARWLPDAPEPTVVKLYDSEKAELNEPKHTL